MMSVMEKTFKTAFAVLTALQPLDGIFTYMGIAKRLASEANPLAAALIDAFGLGGGIIVGKGLALLIIWGCYRLGVQGLKWSIVIPMVTLALFYAYTVVRNFIFLI
jgi:hypothetical protein